MAKSLAGCRETNRQENITIEAIILDFGQVLTAAVGPVAESAKRDRWLRNRIQKGMNCGYVSLREMGLANELFDVIITSATTGMVKPDLAVFFAHLSQIESSS